MAKMARRRYSVDFAGEALDFELPSVSEEGRTQTETVLSDYFPELKLSVGPKGTRGGRLGRGMSQVSKELTLKQRTQPTSIQITNAPSFTQSQTQTATSTPTQTFTGSTGSAGTTTTEVPKAAGLQYTDPGDKGYFGIKDYNELLSQGASQEQIKEYAKRAQYGVGPLASQILGVKPYTETQGILTQFPISTVGKTPPALETVPDLGDVGWFGKQDYDYMKNAGFTEAQIKYKAGQAQYGIGSEVANTLGLSSSPRYTYTDPGDKGVFGQKDYDELAGQGVSETEMKRIASTMQLGPAIRQRWGM